MPRATFIDANVPIYAAGRKHPYRQPCIQVLAAVNENPDGFVTDAEVFQEIMHHYRRTQRWDAGQTVVESFAAMMHGRVSPVDIDDVPDGGTAGQRTSGIEHARSPAPGRDAPPGRDPHCYGRRRLRRGAGRHQAGPGRLRGTGNRLEELRHALRCPNQGIHRSKQDRHRSAAGQVRRHRLRLRHGRGPGDDPRSTWRDDGCSSCW